MPYLSIDLDLDRPVPPVTLDAKEGGIAVPVLRGGPPLAFWLKPHHAGASIAAEDLTTRIASEARVDQVRDAAVAEVGARGAPGPFPTVTVAVRTHGRPERLARCLRSIGALRVPPDDPPLDVLVVDNAPPDDRAREQVAAIPGALLVSSPHTRWRTPQYEFIKPYAPSEESLFEEREHVRRGYTREDLEAIIQWPCESWSSIINPVTSLTHDISSSHVPYRRKIVAAFSPLTWLGYALHRPHAPGSETASGWPAPRGKDG